MQTTGSRQASLSRHVGQTLDVGLGLDPRRQHTVRGRELEHALKVAGDRDEDDRRDADADRGAKGDAPKSRHQLVAEAESRRSRQGRRARERHVEGDGGIERGQLADHGVDYVAEVVVANAEPGQPGVVRGVVRAAAGGVEKHEVHGLLGARDLRDERLDVRRDEEAHEENDLGGKEKATTLLERIEVLGPSPAQDQEVDNNEGDEGPDDGAGPVGQDVQTEGEPEQVTREQQAERLREGDAASGQAVEKRHADGQGDQPNDGDDQPPAKGLLNHRAGLASRRMKAPDSATRTVLRRRLQRRKG